MEILDVIRNRRSVRAYLPKSVEEDKLMRIMEAARLAPSASNRQEWRYIVVREETTRKELMKAAYNQHFVGEAPVVIAACAETDNHVMACGQLCYPIDVAISIDHIALQAVAEGLGTCWIGKFDEESVKQLLGIPAEIRVVELLTLGYPVAGTSVKKRLPIEKIVKFERWS